MGLSIYTHNQDAADFRATPVYGSCSFSLRFSDMGTMHKHWKNIDGKWINEVHGICNEINGVSYSVSWDDGPGATFITKAKEFTQAEAFKLFGGPKFDSNAATGKWTQQYPKEGCDFSVSLKFRAYKQGNYANTTSYMTLIKWLTYMTSPLHEFNIMAEIDNIKDALGNAKEAGEEFANQLNSMSENGRVNYSAWEKVGQFTNEIEKTLKSMGTSSRSHITLLVQVGDLIKMNSNVDWFIESWNFKPSQHLAKPEKDECEIGMPLYCDFEVTLRTNTKLSNSAFKSILNISD